MLCNLQHAGTGKTISLKHGYVLSCFSGGEVLVLRRSTSNLKKIELENRYIVFCYKCILMNKQILFVITAVLLSAAFATVALYTANAAKAQPDYLPSTPPPETPSRGGNATDTTGAAGANMSK